MKTLDEFFKDLWHWKIDKPVINRSRITCEDNQANIKKHWLPFLTLQFNRLFMGGLRYGLINDPGKAKYERVREIGRRLEKYEATGNTEYLVDIANIAFLEAVEGEHPNKHFSSIDDGEHAKVKHG